MLLELFHNCILRDPPEDVSVLHTSGGTSSRLSIYVDNRTNIEYLKCDICSKFITIGKGRSTRKMVKHRATTECSHFLMKFEHQIKVWQEQRQVAMLQETLFASGGKVPTGMSTQPPTGTSDIPTLETTNPGPSYRPSINSSPNVVVASFASNISHPSISAVLESPPPTQLDDDDNNVFSTDDNVFSTSTAELPLLEHWLNFPCAAQWVHWIPGSPWDTYAYQQHEHPLIAWTLLAVYEEQVQLRSKKCSGFLQTAEERKAKTCDPCVTLVGSEALARFMERLTGEAEPNTPWIYLNAYQSRQLMTYMSKTIKRLRKISDNRNKSLETLQNRVTDYKRLVSLISQQRIGGVASILAIGIQQKSSPVAMYEKVQQAITGVYRPRGKWTQREYDIAFLAKALGGSRLLYVFQSAEAYPSGRTLKQRRPIPNLIVPAGRPEKADFDINISAMLGRLGRPAGAYLSIGFDLMIDGVGLEEALRYHHRNERIVGLCREHAHQAPNAPKFCIEEFSDITNLSEALYSKQVCHHGKDGTVLAISPVTGEENYYPTPVFLSPSCKTETGEELALWISDFLDAYHNHPDGAKKHGPITCIATDGEGSFRSMRYKLGLSRQINPLGQLGQRLYALPGFNCCSGIRGIINTSDPKHVIKRFASMIRSSRGVQVGDTTLKREDFRRLLLGMPELNEKQIDALLNPADKQNVPMAVNLLQHLLNGSSRISSSTNPSFQNHLRKINFVMTVISHFLLPFIKTDMSLSDQLKSLSTYTHLLTAMQLKHGGSFMNAALFADSQSIVKSIFHTANRLQLIDPEIKYFILFNGSDQLEGIFSNTRTQDHARNFDALQLQDKLSVAGEVNAIYERNPDLYEGHIRRNLQGSRSGDHLNPKSWKGDATLGNVDIHKSYMEGRDAADALLSKHDFDLNSWIANWDTIFSDPKCDHLRPEGVYVGSRAQDADEKDNDSERLVGQLSDPLPVNGAFVAINSEIAADLVPEDNSEIDEASDIIPQLLNPLPEEDLRKGYLIVEDSRKPRHIDSIVAEYLVSNRARKSTQRTLRVRDITVEESVKRVAFLNDPDGLPNTSNLIKHSDLGVFLVRLADSVCLAVGEIISFHQKSNRRELTNIKAADLAITSGQDAVTVTMQIIGLSAGEPDAEGEFSWCWTRKYIRLLTVAGADSQKSYTMSITGPQFFPIGPDLDLVDNNAVWSIKNADLQAIFDEQWGTLDHENDDSLASSIEIFPSFDPGIIGLPYIAQDNKPAFCVSSIPGIVISTSTKLKRTDKIHCLVCGVDGILLPKMRAHIGRHILRAIRVREIDLVWNTDHTAQPCVETPSIGLHPCGWCGLSSTCRTRLELRPSKPASTKITSNCKYHYTTLRYGMASISTESSPCTNLPIQCPLCKMTFWKYNFVHHMSSFHINEDGETLPNIPPELRLVTHISRLEELRMGVEVIQTTHYRTKHHIPDSDALEAPVTDSPKVPSTPIQKEMSPLPPSSPDTQTPIQSANNDLPLDDQAEIEARKRAFSVLSTTSSLDSRAPRASKLIRF